MPSWLYEVKMGATTIWERWNSILPDGQFSDVGMNSLNHYAYGSIVEWMYRNALGINPVELSPDGCPAQGFKHAFLTPMPHSRLAWANGEYMSAMGAYKSAWRVNEDGSLTLTAKVPFNATATWVLPDVPEGMLPCEKAVRSADGTVTIPLIPGEHTVTYMPAVSYIPRYNMDSTLGELTANPEIKTFLCNLDPRLKEMLDKPLGVNAGIPICDLVNMPFGDMPDHMAERVKKLEAYLSNMPRTLA